MTLLFCSCGCHFTTTALETTITVTVTQIPGPYIIPLVRCHIQRNICQQRSVYKTLKTLPISFEEHRGISISKPRAVTGSFPASRPLLLPSAGPLPSSPSPCLSPLCPAALSFFLLALSFGFSGSWLPILPFLY